MKRILKKIIVLVCVATLLVMPASTALAATSTPVLVINYDGVKYFDYQPDFVLNAFTTTGLDDTTNPIGWGGCPWTVTAGKTFRVQITTVETNTSLQVLIISPTNGLMYNQILSTTNGGFMIDLPIASNDSYLVWVTAQYTPVTIRGYGGFLLNQ